MRLTRKKQSIPLLFLLCTSDLNKAAKQNILKRHKSLQQKTHVALKRRNSYAQLGPLKRKKCLDSFKQYYKDNRLHILSASAEKYKSMNADEKHNLVGKCKEKYKSIDPDEKHNLLAKCKKKYHSMDTDQKHSLLAASKEKYVSMDAAKKQNLLTACADKYKAMDKIKNDQKSTLTSAGNEIFNIAPGQSRHPVSMMNDKHCEELVFPILFPKGRFGHKEERTVKLSPTKYRYFNARLLHYSGRFAMNPEYLFFCTISH